MSGRRDGCCTRRCNSPEFLFHLPEAVAEILSIRALREYLNLAASLASGVLAFESRITGVGILLVRYMNNLRGDRLSFYDDFTI